MVANKGSITAIYFLGNIYVAHFPLQGKQIKRTPFTTAPHIAKPRTPKLMEVAGMVTKGDKPDVSGFDFSGKLSKNKFVPQMGEMETDGTQQERRSS